MKLLVISLILIISSSLANASSGQAVYTDGTTSMVSLSSNPPVPQLGCPYLQFVGSGGDATMTITTPHGGSYGYIPYNSEPNKAGMSYARASVGKLSGNCQITLRVNLVKKSNGATASVDFVQQISPRAPYIGQEVSAGSITGDYRTIYDVNSQTSLSAYDSAGQVFESGTTKVPLTASQAASCSSTMDLFPSESNGVASTTISQTLSHGKSGRIAYTGEGILPSKVTAVLTLKPYGRMDGEYSAKRGTDPEGGYASIINRITFTSPLLSGPKAIDLKKEISGSGSESLSGTIDPGTTIQKKVMSGEVAIASNFTASLALLMNCEVKKGDVMAGSTVEASGLGSLSVGPYEIEQWP